jgi:SAM-dependent methyltransferase
MESTPAHDEHNPDLLAVMPATARVVAEIGCSTGALAREYRKLNPAARYIGVEISEQIAALARRHCAEVHALDVELLGDARLAELLPADCWVFGDTLEHLRDPWAMLARVRAILPPDGCVVACIPNAQHWSVQARLACGQFRYEDAGLLDRTHLRWFTRMTLVDLFVQAGLRIELGFPRPAPEPDQPRVMQAIRAMAVAVGADPDAAQRDAIPIQYIVRAVPA